MRRATLAAVFVIALAATVGAAALAVPAMVTPFDAHWLKGNAQGDLYEVAVGKLALQKGSGDACSIGKMLVADHDKSLKDVRALAKQTGVTLPAKPNPLQQVLIGELSRLEGSNFQRLFAYLGFGDHKLDIAEASETANEASDRRVRTMARTELPVPRKHLSAFTSLWNQTRLAGGSESTTTTAKTPGTTTTTTAATSSAVGCS